VIISIEHQWWHVTRQVPTLLKPVEYALSTFSGGLLFTCQFSVVTPGSVCICTVSHGLILITFGRLNKHMFTNMDIQLQNEKCYMLYLPTPKNWHPVHFHWEYAYPNFDTLCLKTEQDTGKVSIDHLLETIYRILRVQCSHDCTDWWCHMTWNG